MKNNFSKKVKLIILMRVIPHYRVPVFEKLAAMGIMDMKVIYGPDFEGTKVVSAKGDYVFPKERLRAIRIRARSINNMILMHFSPFLIFKLIREKPEVIIAEGASNLLNALQAFLYAKLFGKKFIWWSLGRLQYLEMDIKRKRLNFLIHWIERNADAIITYSTFGKRYFIDIGVKPERIFVAVNVIDTDRCLQKIENYNREDIYKEFHQVSGFNILYVGGLDKGKRLDVLIRAFAALYEKYGKDVALHIVGKGRMLEELKQQGCPNIYFHGQVIDDVNRYFLGADVFVLPGLGGLAISEAMSHGLPVIASIGDGCELDLIDNTNGILDPQLNEDKLFRYLDDLYRDKNKLKDMKEASLRKIKEQYNTQEYLVNFRGAIDFVVAG